MKFDTVKRNAKKIYAGSMTADVERNAHAMPGLLAKGSGASFQTVLPFVLAGQAERAELREFAQAYNSFPGDLLAKSIKADGIDSAWSQVVFRAREAGLRLISDWDVRQAGKLIELFPDCVPASYRTKKLTCFVADNKNGDWMVEVA